MNRKEKRLNIILKTVFNSKEYKFVGDHKFILGGKNPDFISTTQRKIIELYGDYWHNPLFFPNKQTPEERINFFNGYGFDCLIIWEHELKDIDTLKQKLIRFNNE